jgi:ABC-type phosphate transport system substrate-binding protein
MSLGLARSLGGDIKILAVDQVPATNANIEQGKYIWRRELILVIPIEKPSPEALAFVKFVQENKSKAMSKFEFMDF